MKFLHVPFILIAVVALVLATATFIEQSAGHDAVVRHVYASWWMILLWGAMATSGMAVIIRRRHCRRPATILLHCALVVILVGALITHLWGTQGTVHLRTDAPEPAVICQGRIALRLIDFHVETYPGTPSPMDFVSMVEVAGGGMAADTVYIAMNKIGKYHGYRFYQSGYDDDQLGTSLSYSHDPWGISVTYTGYAMLFLAIVLMLILPNESYRRLLKSRKTARLTVLITLFLATASPARPASGTTVPKTLPKATAQAFGNLYVYHNGRICPVQTLARDFTTKLTGKPSYKGLSAEQVLCGWIFFPTEWIEEPMIKVKASVAASLGVESRRVAYKDFYDDNRYKLENTLNDIYTGKKTDGRSDFLQADEKLNTLLMLFNGGLLKLFPVARTDTTSTLNCETEMGWYSPNDLLPKDIGDEKGMFVKKSIDYAGELAWMRQYDKLEDLFGKIKKYQENEARGLLPDDKIIAAERLYNKIDYNRQLAYILMGFGLMLIVLSRITEHNRKHEEGLPGRKVIAVVVMLLLLYLAFIIVLRGIVGRHLPLSNGYETMQFMALMALLATLFTLRQRFQNSGATKLPAFSLLVGGLCLLVATMGGANPQITPLVPVLSSPLLSLHVCIIMTAYALLAIACINSIACLFSLKANDIAEETTTTLIILYPAVCCLAAGIFIGAIWANQSWGRYWGWDPKEVWALVTLLVYSIPLHTDMLAWLRRPLWFHLYIALAFITILMTYFGVNFFLGGMHSYA